MRSIINTGLAIVLAFSSISLAQAPQPDAENRDAILEALQANGLIERPPVVLIRPDAKKPSRPIQLTKVGVDVTIAAHVARTSVTMTFRNDLDRPMEGNLVFPLPVGSTVSGYALDIDGKLRDAVPVEKNQARIIFETEQRYGIDPGLVEWVKGNTFKTRVWPIPAKGKRTIRVDYVSALQPAGKDRAGYLLPLRYPDKLEELAVNVDVIGERNVVTIGDPWLAVAETKSGRKIVGRITNEKPAEDLAIALPAASGKAYVGTREGTDDTYFVVHDQIAPPVGINIGVRKPEAIGLYWDISMSRRATDKAAQLSLIEKTLAKIGDVRVDVTLFNNAMRPRETFTIVEGDATKLIKYLKEARYDGATNYRNLIIPATNHGFISADTMRRVRLAAPVKYDMHLMFTDGMDNIGDPTPEPIHPTRRGAAPDKQPPLFVFSGGSNANAPLLRSLAENRGGFYIDLRNHVGEKAIEPIAQSISGVPALMLRLFKVEYDKTQIADVYPNRVTTTSGPIAVAGRLIAEEATVTLHYGLAPGATITRKHTIRKSDATINGLIPGLWAQKKVDALLANPRKHQSELTQVGRDFGIVTPGMSLLVLETLDQYVRYEIAPPKSLPKLFDQWQKQVAKREKQVAKTKKEKIDQVVAMWNERMKWWDTKFEYPEGFKWTDKVKKQLLTRIEAQGRVLDGQIENLQGLLDEANEQERTQIEGRMRQLRERRQQVTESAQRVTDADGEALEELVEDGGGENTLRSRVAASGGLSVTADAIREDAAEPAPEAPPVAQAPQAAATAQFANVDTQPAPKSAKDDGKRATPSASIALKPWNPKTPYMAAIKKAGPDKAYDEYFAQRAKHGYAPAFYIDVADYLLRNGQTEAGVSVLTSVLELGIEDVRLIRIVAHKLKEVGLHDDAIDLFERAKELRPEEPQSYRDLALALEARADQRLARTKGSTDGQLDIYSDYSDALDELGAVITGNWDGRFERIEVIAVMEANRIIGRMMSLDVKVKRAPLPIDPRLRKLLDVDARIVMGWDTDLTDIDLWVIEPSGEKCFYSHNRTTIGGSMTRDFTQGYGPEVYNIRKAMPGKYKIKANYYGTSQATLTGGTTIQLTLITNFGRADEKREAITVRVTAKKEIVDIGEITIGE